MKSFKLSNNSLMPALALGTYRTSGDSLAQAVKYAIECGYRHFDCAWVYGNENIIGQVIKTAISESKGKLKREDFFLTSKVWNTFHSKVNVKNCLNETLKNLQIDYLDLYLIHWPMGFEEKFCLPIFPDYSGQKPKYSDVSYLETYKAMEGLVQEGLVKNIGVSNFNIEQLQCILDNCEIKPVNNQIEMHPYLQNDELLEFCKKNDIIVSCYGPLGAGEKTTIKGVPNLLNNPVIRKIGKKYNKTSAQVCIRWALQKGLSVLPKSITPSRILENFQVFDFELSEEDMSEIKKMDCNMRLLAGIERYNFSMSLPKFCKK